MYFPGPNVVRKLSNREKKIMWLHVNVSLLQKKVAKCSSLFSQLNEVNAILIEPHVGSFCSLILFSRIIWVRWTSKSFSFKDRAARNTWSNTNKHTQSTVESEGQSDQLVLSEESDPY